MEKDFVDAEHRALAVPEPKPQPAPVALFNTEDPAEVIGRATAVADALKRVLVQKKLVKKIGTSEHVEIAGWQTLGAMTGVFAVPEWTRPIPNGFEARVVVQKNGVVVGAAEAQCTRSEATWKKRDDYALRSMAQTRAASKALRGVLGFIVVLAGYNDTPADEMPEPPERAASKASDAKENLRAALDYEAGTLTGADVRRAVSTALGRLVEDDNPLEALGTVGEARKALDEMRKISAEYAKEVPM